ncbi:hypothetical protein [Paucilactobacillus sp. N302-9]|jgi:Cft2 family RNA processing exonuclease
MQTSDNSKYEKNRRSNLKKYRGLLLSEMTDLYTKHDAIRDHKLGEDTDHCEYCAQYVDDKKTFDKLGQIVNVKRQELRQRRLSMVRIYYYLCTYANADMYLLKATSSSEATRMITSKLQTIELPVKTFRINKRDALNLIETSDVEDAQNYVDFLKNNRSFTGVIMKKGSGRMVAHS